MTHLLVFVDHCCVLFAAEVDEKTISQLEASNKSLSGELKETKGDLSHLRESLKSLEDTNCHYEDQLTKTIRELSATMEGIQTVLSRVSVWFMHP